MLIAVYYYKEGDTDIYLPLGLYSESDGKVEYLLDSYLNGTRDGISFQIMGNPYKLMPMLSEPNGVPTPINVFCNNQIQYLDGNNPEVVQKVKEFVDFYLKAQADGFKLNDIISKGASSTKSNLEGVFETGGYNPLPDKELAEEYRKKVNSVVSPDDVMDNIYKVAVLSPDNTEDNIKELTAMLESITGSKCILTHVNSNVSNNPIVDLTEDIRNTYISQGYSNVTYYTNNVIEAVQVFCHFYNFEFPKYLSANVNKPKVLIISPTNLSEEEVEHTKALYNAKYNADVDCQTYIGSDYESAIRGDFVGELTKLQEMGKSSNFEAVLYWSNSAEETIDKFHSAFNRDKVNLFVVTANVKTEEVVRDIINKLSSATNTEFEISEVVTASLGNTVDDVVNTTTTQIASSPSFNMTVAYINETNDFDFTLSVYNKLYNKEQHQPMEAGGSETPSFILTRDDDIDIELIKNYFKNNYNLDIDISYGSEPNIKTPDIVECVNIVASALGLKPACEGVVLTNTEQGSDAVQIPFKVGDRLSPVHKDFFFMPDGCTCEEDVNSATELLNQSSIDDSDYVVVIDNNNIYNINYINHYLISNDIHPICIVGENIKSVDTNVKGNRERYLEYIGFDANKKLLFVNENLQEVDDFIAYYTPVVEETPIEETPVESPLVVEETPVEEPTTHLDTTFGGGAVNSNPTSELITTSVNNPYFYDEGRINDIPNDIKALINNATSNGVVDTSIIKNALISNDNNYNLNWLSEKVLQYAPEYIYGLLNSLDPKYYLKLLYANTTLNSREFIYEGKHLLLYLLEYLGVDGNNNKLISSIFYNIVKLNHKVSGLQEVERTDDDEDDSDSYYIDLSGINENKVSEYTFTSLADKLWANPSKQIPIDPNEALPHDFKEKYILDCSYLGLVETDDLGLRISVMYNNEYKFGKITFFYGNVEINSEVLISVFNSIFVKDDEYSLDYRKRLEGIKDTYFKEALNNGFFEDLTKDILLSDNFIKHVLTSKREDLISFICSSKETIFNDGNNPDNCSFRLPYLKENNLPINKTTYENGTVVEGAYVTVGKGNSSVYITYCPEKSYADKLRTDEEEATKLYKYIIDYYLLPNDEGTSLWRKNGNMKEIVYILSTLCKFSTSTYKEFSPYILGEKYVAFDEVRLTEDGTTYVDLMQNYLEDCGVNQLRLTGAISKSFVPSSEDMVACVTTIFNSGTKTYRGITHVIVKGANNKLVLYPITNDRYVDTDEDVTKDNGFNIIKLDDNIKRLQIPVHISGEGHSISETTYNNEIFMVKFDATISGAASRHPNAEIGGIKILAFKVCELVNFTNDVKEAGNDCNRQFELLREYLATKEVVDK